MWARWLLAFIVAAAIWAQQNPKDLLVEMSSHVVDSTGHPPEYLTTETIERKYFEPSRWLHSCDDFAAEKKSSHWRSQLATSDMVRADVAVGATTERYSWRGENQYAESVDAIQFVDDRESAQFLLQGASTLVGLSSLVRTILGGEEEAIFSYGNDQQRDGRLLTGFGFEVSRANSHLQFNIAGRQLTTAYHGDVLVDAKSADPVRIVIRTPELPPSAGICEVTQVLDYGTVRLDGKDFLLPEQVLSRLAKSDGTQFENRATYANFRSFSPQAKLMLSGAGAASPQPALPAGIHFTIALDEPIDTATAGFGDQVHASLTRKMKDESGDVLFPAGAAVDGRIIKLLRVYGRRESSYSLTVLIRWETVTHNGVSRSFTARAIEGSRVPLAQPPRLGGVLLREADGFPLRINDNGLFEIQGLKVGSVFSRGMRSAWKTETP